LHYLPPVKIRKVVCKITPPAMANVTNRIEKKRVIVLQFLDLSPHRCLHIGTMYSPSPSEGTNEIS
jgi:hypothetical protein